jgi:hypothetical protein
VLDDHPDKSFNRRLRVLTENQALEVMAQLLAKTDEIPFSEAEREQALTLANTVGRLPMALELAARRIARGSSWAELNRALEAKIADLDALEPDTRRRLKGNLRVEASINVSLDWLRKDLEPAWQCFVWLGALPEDAIINPLAAATWWQGIVKREKAADILEYLFHENLLLELPALQLGSRIWPAYMLHDLLHDVARRRLEAEKQQGLGLTLQQANEKLLNRYQRLTIDGLWHTLPADGYIQANLTWHMEHAGQIEAIHQLLAEETRDGRNSWYLAPAPPDKGNAYATDVYRAWYLAEKAYEDQPNGQDIGRQCRYALIIAFLNNLAGNISPELLRALVQYKEEEWPQAKALAYIEQIPDVLSHQKAAALNHLVDLLRPELLPKALVSAQSMSDARARAEALTGLAPQFPEKERAEILAQALTAAQDISDVRERDEVLAAMLPRFSEETREEILDQATAPLTPQLPEEERVGTMAETLAAAQAINDVRNRVEVLVALAARLPQGERMDLLTRALAAAQTIDHGGDLARAVAAVVPQLPEESKAEIVAQTLVAAQTIEDAETRARALAALAPHLPEGLVAQALTTAQAIDDAESRARVLADLVPQLPVGLVVEALFAVVTIYDTESRAKALEALALLLAGLQPAELYLRWRQALRVLARRAREDVLSDLVALVPVIEALGGRDAIEETAQAILDVGRWWP